MTRKITFLGPVSPPISGPGVKNKLMIEWLNDQNIYNIEVLNTHIKKNLKSYVNFFLKFLTSGLIILSVSKNGRFIFIPLCFLLQKKVLLFPAGGNFDDEILQLPKFIQWLYLKTCSCIKVCYPQTINLQNGLLKLGFQNVKYFPNPRKIYNYTSEVKFTDVFKIIFLSKIRETKGPLLLIDAVESIRKSYPHLKIFLDFYGGIDENFKTKFFSYLSNNELNNYCGISQPKDVQSIISKYHLYTLPTFYKGEGVPGALLEAMFTGIPIITTDFVGVSELISDGKEGIVIPQNNVNAIVTAIEKILNNIEIRKLYSFNVKEKSKSFDLDKLMGDVVTDIYKISK